MAAICLSTRALDYKAPTWRLGLSVAESRFLNHPNNGVAFLFSIRQRRALSSLQFQSSLGGSSWFLKNFGCTSERKVVSSARTAFSSLAFSGRNCMLHNYGVESPMV